MEEGDGVVELPLRKGGGQWMDGWAALQARGFRSRSVGVEHAGGTPVHVRRR